MADSREYSKNDVSQHDSSNLGTKNRTYSFKIAKTNEKLSKTLSKNALKLKMAAAINDPKILNQSKDMMEDDSEVRSNPLNFHSDPTSSQTV